MTAVRILVVIGALVAVYVVLFSNDLPNEIEFRGQVLGPREEVENNSVKNFDIYSYRDQTNHHVMLFVMAKDESATSQELLEFYVEVFTAQGAKFRTEDGRYLGTRDDEVIYMTRAPQIDSALAYIEKSPDAPRRFGEANDIFTNLENYSFE